MPQKQRPKFEPEPELATEESPEVAQAGDVQAELEAKPIKRKAAVKRSRKAAWRQNIKRKK